MVLLNIWIISSRLETALVKSNSKVNASFLQPEGKEFMLEMGKTFAERGQGRAKVLKEHNKTIVAELGNSYINQNLIGVYWFNGL